MIRGFLIFAAIASSVLSTSWAKDNNTEIQLAANLQLETSGYIALGRKSCGEAGVYKIPTEVYVVVVGHSGGRSCIISITDRHLAVSDFKAGYVCVTPDSAKFASIVTPDDKRVTTERGYKEILAKATQYANSAKVPLRVLYVDTASGPPHAERRCSKL